MLDIIAPYYLVLDVDARKERGTGLTQPCSAADVDISAVVCANLQNLTAHPDFWHGLSHNMFQFISLEAMSHLGRRGTGHHKRRTATSSEAQTHWFFSFSLFSSLLAVQDRRRP